MKTKLSDTNPSAEEALINLIRKKSINERLSQVESLTSLVLQLSRRAITRANPGKNKRELDLLFIKYHYGEDLSDKVRRYLIRNNL